MTYARPIPDPDTTYHCYYCHWQGTGAEYRAQILDAKLSGCCDTPWLEPCRILTPPPMEGSRAAAPHPPGPGTPSACSVPPAQPAALPPLKPCPFCGSEAEVEQGDYDVFVVSCRNDHCQVMPDTAFCSTQAEAVKIWNHRVPTTLEGVAPSTPHHLSPTHAPDPITLSDIPDLLEDIEGNSSCGPASPERIPPILEDEDLSEAEKLEAIIYELDDDIRCINQEAHETVCELEDLRDGLIARLNTLTEDPRQ